MSDHSSRLAARLSFKANVQFAWDSTSLTTFKECPRKYYYNMILGKVPRAENVHFIFGIHYHKGLEIYDHLRCDGIDHESAVHTMTRMMLERTWGWQSDDKNKNRYTLIRTLIWYLEEFKEDKAKTIVLANGKPAVELSFQFNLPIKTSDGTQYQYSGHMDRLVEFIGELYVADRKTTKQALYSDFFDKFNPNVQMSGYTFGGKVVFHTPVKGVLIDAAQVGVTFSRFNRGFTNRSEFQLEEWLDSAMYDIKRAEACAQADVWPMNESACGNYGGCPYRGICAKRSWRERDIWLQSDYVERIWDPLVARGDI